MGMAEPIDPKEDTTGPKPPSTLDIARGELHRLVHISAEYQRRINTAKTRAKVQFYKKKLKKNNLKVMQMSVAVDKLEKRHGDTSSD